MRGPACDELHGRGSLIRFVERFVDRHGLPETAAPVILLLGARGSGKTALLEKLRERQAPRAPTVLLDLHKVAVQRTFLLDVRDGLSHRVPRVGTVRLPLLRLGLLALSLDPQSNVRPPDQLEQKLRGEARALRTKAENLARQATRLLQKTGQAIAAIAISVIGWLLNGISARRLRRRLNWYRDVAGPGNGTAGGPLLELWDRWQEAARGDDESAQFVWRVLCEALLADLRDDFNEFRWRHGRRTVNCMLLLDNADSDVGTAFLTALAECRRHPRGKADPLVVVAAQGVLSDPAHGISQPVPVSQLNPQGAWQSGWCPILLANLSATDLSDRDMPDMVQSTVFRKPWQNADFVFAVTGGHPDAIRRLDARLRQPPLDPRQVLALPAGSGAGSTVEDDLLARLRPLWVLDDDLDRMGVFLTTLAPRMDLCASVFMYLGWSGADVLRTQRMLVDLMWAEPETGDGLVVRPLPRLLLVRRLARDADLWERVHIGYLSRYQNPGDWIAKLYHELALTAEGDHKNVHKIAAVLDEQITKAINADAWTAASAHAWNADLVQVTKAPVRLVSPGMPIAIKNDQRDVVKALAGLEEPGDRLRIVTRLVAARWLARDRLFDPAHRLAGLIKDEYLYLAGKVEGDAQVFYQEAAEFDELAEKWKDSLR